VYVVPGVSVTDEIVGVEAPLGSKETITMIVSFAAELVETELLAVEVEPLAA
jgi:hypothetical protein